MVQVEKNYLDCIITATIEESKRGGSCNLHIIEGQFDIFKVGSTEYRIKFLAVNITLFCNYHLEIGRTPKLELNKKDFVRDTGVRY